MRIRLRDTGPPIELQNLSDLESVLAKADSEARELERPNVISVVSPDGQRLTFVVGSDESVLQWDRNGALPYMVSKGETDAVRPLMAAWVGLVHHTEFRRAWVITSEHANLAVRQFFETSCRPDSVEWTEI